MRCIMINRMNSRGLREYHIAVADLGGDPGAQRNPLFCQDVKVFCFVFLYNGFINSLAPLERVRERALPLLFKLGLLKHRKWAGFVHRKWAWSPKNFSGMPDVGTTLSQILNPPLYCL